MSEPLLTTAEASEYLRLSARTLESWRLHGGGPRYVKLGARVLYRQGDLEAWVSDQARTSTSDPGPLPPTPRAAVSVLPSRRRTKY